MKMFTKIVSILSVIALFAVAQANASGPTKRPNAPKVMMKGNKQTTTASSEDEVSANSTRALGVGLAIGATAADTATDAVKNEASQ